MQEQQQNKEGIDDVPFWHLFIYVGLVLLLWGSAWVLSNILLDDLVKRGQFGDSFGAVNALFSGLAFAVLIFTIRQQKQEIQQTQKLIKQQEQELQEQNETLRLQKFENTFFNLISLHQEILNGIKINLGGERVAVSREAIGEIYARFERGYASNTEKVESVRIQNSYRHIYAHFGHLYGHYIKNLESILRYLSLNSYKKSMYEDMLIAMLSESELKIVFYHAYAHEAGAEFKGLVEAASLFRNLDSKKLISYAHAGSLLDGSAFQK